MSDGIETIRNADVGDVAVRKTIETGDDDTATVTLEVSAHREEPLVVQLTEPVLADVPTDDVDLHEEYGAEHWRLDDGAVFERRFDGGESCTTVYRVRNVDEERLRHIDADPEIEVEADAPGDLDDVVDREGSEAVRRLIEGRADSLTVGADRSGTSAETPDGIPGTSDGIDEAATDPSDASDDIAAALLAELQAGEVDDEVASQLRDELRVGKSHDVRIRHLQRQVGDLQGNLTAFEERLDGVESFADRLSEVFQHVDEDGDN